MVKERVVFEQEYVGWRDIESIEGKIEECIQGKYMLSLDFSKAKSGVHTDFYMAILERFQKDRSEEEFMRMLKDNILFIFESEDSKPYEKFERLCLDKFINYEINNEKYKSDIVKT